MYHNNNNNQYYDPPNHNNFNYNYNPGSYNQNYYTPPPSFPQYHNQNFNQRPHYQQQQTQNYQQQQQSSSGINWKSNKRPHDFVSPSSSRSSPEPKRQFQKRYGNDNIHHQRPIDHQPQQKQPNLFRNNFPHAAFQTQPTIYTPQSQQNSPQQFMKKPPQQGGQGWKKIKQEHPIVKIQEDRKKEWDDKMSLTLSQLYGCSAGEEAQILLSYLQPPRTVWFKTKEDIHNDLIKFLTPLGVEKVLVFGSSLTGLDFHGSDLDFYVQLRSHPVTEEETRIIISKAAKLTRVLKGSEFMIICTIQGARVPLVRLLHRRSKVSCDVNFTSKFGYYNSYFLGHVVSFDKRIKELAVILKIWAKSCKLPSNMIISNYCLMMLMIFYLQNLQEPMLDTILNNQRNRSPMVLDEKKKWNFYFNDDINQTRNNHQSLRELLTGFFEYFGNINPQEEMISLLLGRLIKRSEFAADPDLEDSRRLINSCGLPQFKVDSPEIFHVQDAFELNLNIGIKTKKNVDSFFEVIKLSHEKCQEMGDKPFSELLVKLFTDIQLPVVQNNNNNAEGNGKRSKAKKKFELIIHAIPGDLKVNDFFYKFKSTQCCQLKWE